MTDKLSERTPQTKLNELRALPNDKLLEKAWAEISALCGSNKGPQKRWTMHIPVDAENDSDVLFGEVLSRFAVIEQRVEGLEEGLKTLSDPMVYEGIPIFHGTKQPWLIAKEALASQEEA